MSVLMSAVDMLSPGMEGSHCRESRRHAGGSRGAKDGFDNEFDATAGGTRRPDEA